MVTHLFACTRRGYVGWRWSVTVTRASRHKAVTVDEVVLIPATRRSSPRPGCPTASGSSPATCRPVTCSRSATRTRGWSRRTPSATTRSTPTTRRRSARSPRTSGSAGCAPSPSRDASRRPALVRRRRRPDSPLAQSAPHHCRSCGFLVRIAGPLTDTFGVCANGDANDDGRVVSTDHGCGAHSEVRLAKKHEPQPLPGPRLRHPQHRRGRELLGRGGARAGPSASRSARRLRRLRQYSSPNSPSPKPARQVQSHQVCPSSSSRL